MKKHWEKFCKFAYKIGLFQCPKGLIHDWEITSYETGYTNISGFKVPFTYCEKYKCKKCGIESKWNEK